MWRIPSLIYVVGTPPPYPSEFFLCKKKTDVSAEKKGTLNNLKVISQPIQALLISYVDASKPIVEGYVMSQFISVLPNYYAVPYGKDGVSITTMISCTVPATAQWKRGQSLASHSCQMVNARGYMTR